MAKKAFFSLALLWFGSILGRGSTFIIYFILARELGADLFGVFSSAMATIMIFTLIAGFGIAQVWLQLFGAEGWRAVRWVRPSLNFVAASLGAIIIFILLIIALQADDVLTNKLLLLLFLFLCGYIGVQLVASKLQLEERYNNLTILQFLPNLVRLLLLILIIYVFRDELNLDIVGAVYASVGMVFSIISFLELKKMSKGDFDLKGHTKSPDFPSAIEKEKSLRIKDIFARAWPFGFAGIFAFVYIQSDIIMVRYISGNSEAAFYNVAFTVLSAIMTIPIILFSKYLIPKYHRWSNQNKSLLISTHKKGNLFMILTGILIALGLLLVSPFLIPLLFGNEYDSSIGLLKILAFSVPLTFISYSYGAILLTDEHVRLKVKLMGSVALFNIVLNIFTIPRYGPQGAAVSTLLSNFLLMVLYRYYTIKKVFSNIGA